MSLLQRALAPDNLPRKMLLPALLMRHCHGTAFNITVAGKLTCPLLQAINDAIQNFVLVSWPHTITDLHSALRALWPPFLGPDCSFEYEDTGTLCEPSYLNFTVLLPPEYEIHLLESAAGQEGSSRGVSSDVVVDSLLLHVLNGRYTAGDFQSMAHNGGCAPVYFNICM